MRDIGTLSNPYGEVAAISDADGYELAEPTRRETFRADDSWLIVADDPSNYAWLTDIEDETIARINYRAALEALTAGDDSLAAEVDMYVPRRGVSVTFLVAHPDLRDEVESLFRAVADYPILDDDEYSRLDFEAWYECWADWACRDVARSVADELGRRGAGYLAELIYWEDLPIDELAAQEAMSYYYGLSGEYDHDGAVDGAMLAALEGAQAF